MCQDFVEACQKLSKTCKEQKQITAVFLVRAEYHLADSLETV